MTHLPEVAVEIDWDNDNYQSPYADITERIIASRVGCGSRPNLSGKSVAVQPAIGSLAVHNRDSLYDPDRAGQIAENTLRARHNCRIRIDNETWWTGTIVLTGTLAHPTVPQLVYTYQGKHTQALTRDKLVIEQSEEGTLNELSNVFERASGVTIAGVSRQPVGIVRWSGNGLYFLENLQRYGGGFCVERNTGDWQFTRWTDTPTLPITARLDASFGPISGWSVADRIGYVRNYVVAEGSEWGNIGRQLIGVSSNTMTQNQQRLFTITSLRGRERAAAWGTATSDVEVVASTGTATLVGQPIIVSDEVRVYRVQTSAFGAGTSRVTVRVFGTVERQTSTLSERIDIDLHDSQTVYGERELILPAWFPGDFAGLRSWTVPYLRNLSQPMKIAEVTYPLIQPTVEQTATLAAAAQTGRRVQMQLGDELFDGFVVRTAIRHGDGIVPELTVTAVNVQREPSPPFGVVIEQVLDTSVEGIVTFENPQQQQVSRRYRTAATRNTVAGDWQPQTSVTADSEEEAWTLAGLTADTAYDLEFSERTDFSVASRARVTTLEAAAVNRFLDFVIVNGKSLDWDFTKYQGFTHWEGFTTATGDITVTAGPVDPNATVAITPNNGKVTGATNGSRHVFTITVTNAGASLAYTLTVNVRTVGTVPTGPISVPDFVGGYRGIAGTSTRIYVLRRDGRVLVWDRSGSRQSSEDITLAGFTLITPKGLAVTHDRFYTLDWSGGAARVPDWIRAWDLTGARDTNGDRRIGDRSHSFVFPEDRSDLAVAPNGDLLFAAINPSSSTAGTFFVNAYDSESVWQRDRSYTIHDWSDSGVQGSYELVAMSGFETVEDSIVVQAGSSIGRFDLPVRQYTQAGAEGVNRGTVEGSSYGMWHPPLSAVVLVLRVDDGQWQVVPVAVEVSDDPAVIIDDLPDGMPTDPFDPDGTGQLPPPTEPPVAAVISLSVSDRGRGTVTIQNVPAGETVVYARSRPVGASAWSTVRSLTIRRGEPLPLQTVTMPVGSGFSSGTEYEAQASLHRDFSQFRSALFTTPGVKPTPTPVPGSGGTFQVRTGGSVGGGPFGLAAAGGLLYSVNFRGSDQWATAYTTSGTERSSDSFLIPSSYLGILSLAFARGRFWLKSDESIHVVEGDGSHDTANSFASRFRSGPIAVGSHIYELGASGVSVSTLTGVAVPARDFSIPSVDRPIDRLGATVVERADNELLYLLSGHQALVYDTATGDLTTGGFSLVDSDGDQISSPRDITYDGTRFYVLTQAGTVYVY